MIQVTSWRIMRMKIGTKQGRHLRNELVRVNQLETVWGGIRFPLSVSITHISFLFVLLWNEFWGNSLQSNCRLHFSETKTPTLLRIIWPINFFQFHFCFIYCSVIYILITASNWLNFCFKTYGILSTLR